MAQEAKPNSVIQLEQVTKDYGRFRALDSVTVSIPPGVTGLLGPNGAGKTTLIKLLLGLAQVTRGSGHILGYQLSRQTREIRSRVGYLPEDDCYIAGISGVEMVQFAARLSGYRKVEALRRAHEILDFCGIDQERYRKVETYSTGMRQKLKFAQSIVHDPPLLILDEPTSSLDPEEREAMLNRVRILSQRWKKSIVISTHILPDVQAICDQVVILVRGQVRMAERLDVLSRPTAPSYVVRFLGNGDAVAQQLRNEGLEVERQHDGGYTVVSEHQDIAAAVWNAARQTEVPVRSLTPARNSLEEIFMEAVGIEAVGMEAVGAESGIQAGGLKAGVERKHADS